MNINLLHSKCTVVMKNLKYTVLMGNLKSTILKEVHYFDLNYDKPLSWYKSFFPLERNNKKITGEASPYSYLETSTFPGGSGVHVNGDVDKCCSLDAEALQNDSSSSSMSVSR